jgi:hypothetical protein
MSTAQKKRRLRRLIASFLYSMCLVSTEFNFRYPFIVARGEYNQDLCSIFSYVRQKHSAAFGASERHSPVEDWPAKWNTSKRRPRVFGRLRKKCKTFKWSNWFKSSTWTPTSLQPQTTWIRGRGDAWYFRFLSHLTVFCSLLYLSIVEVNA